MNTVNVEYTGKDQDWNEGSTTYWFELTGHQFGTASEFDGDVFGVVESGCDEPRFVDVDGCPVDGRGDEPAVRRALADAVTDELRAEY